MTLSPTSNVTSPPVGSARWKATSYRQLNQYSRLRAQIQREMARIRPFSAIWASRAASVSTTLSTSPVSSCTTKRVDEHLGRALRPLAMNARASLAGGEDRRQMGAQLGSSSPYERAAV